MKKFVFSAVAMMAFSVSSMANTIALVVDSFKAEENYTVAENLDDYCYDRSLIVGMQVASQYPNLSDAQIAWYMNVSIAHCMGYNRTLIYQSYPYPN